MKLMSVEISHQTETHSRIIKIEFKNKSLKTPTYFPAISSIETKYQTRDLITLLSNSAYPQMLISAYDYYYHLSKEKNLKKIINNYSNKGNFLFVDSGGYESFWIKRKEWNFNIYKKTISKIDSDFYTSLDDKNEPKSISDYEKFFRKIINAGIILSTSQYLPIFQADSSTRLIEIIARFLKAYPSALRYFAIRERECGTTIVERAKTIFEIRNLLDEEGNRQILHVLGAGHPLSIALYSHCGADSFDSTDWYRYALDLEYLTFRDFSHLEIMDCPCKACTKISDPVTKTLLHNLDMYSTLMIKIQRHIQKDSMKEFLLQSNISEDFLFEIIKNKN